MTKLVPKPKEFFTAICVNKLNIDDFFNLTKLYLPIIGRDAFTLFMSLAAIDQGPKNDSESSHAALFKLLNLSGIPFINAREHLEAMLLLDSFSKETFEFGIEYLYKIKAPLSPNQFFDEPVFAGLLLEKIGKYSFDKLVKEFKTESICEKDTDLINISKKFPEVYNFDLNILNEEDTRINGAKESLVRVENDSDFNFAYIRALMEQKNLHFKSQQDAESILVALHDLYGLNEYELFTKAVDFARSGYILDFEELRSYLAKKTVSKSRKMPEIPEKDDSDQDLKQLGFSNEEIKLIKEAKRSSPIDYLTNIRSQQGGFVDQSEVELLEELQKVFQRTDVINILINYVLNIKENSTLSSNYVLKIANDWLQKGIVDAGTALAFLKNLKKKQKKRASSRRIGRVETVPDYLLKKDDDEEQASDEAVAKLKAELAQMSSFNLANSFKLGKRSS